LKFCVYCGKQYAESDRFCPFCGKPSPGSSSSNSGPTSQTVSTPQRPQEPDYQSSDQRSGYPETRKRRGAPNLKAIGIGIGSLAGIGALVGTAVFVSGLLGGESTELAAFESGILANCDPFGADYQVEFSTELDQAGQPMILLIVGADEMNWTFEPVAGDFFLFEIDSIYSPSAVRAEKLGCSLRFQAQP
jgi:hypothetical protein